jgi:mannose-6-phosphate isomerase-like protein (cupin superfamily)
MGYHVVDPADIDESADHPCGRRSITEALDLTTLALAVYDLAPGEQLSRTYHYHDSREEAFYVLAGELVVETPEREFAVSADRLFVVEPGNPIRPYNPETADEPVRVLGVGAPRFDPGKPYDPSGESSSGDAEPSRSGES